MSLFPSGPSQPGLPLADAPRRFRLPLRRRPEADLGRLPMQMDLRAISLAEGARAGLTVAALIVANEWIGSVLLVEAALGALFTCLCDVGGPVRQRVPALLGFGLLAAAATAGFGLLRNLPVPVVVPLAAFALFCTSYARIWGPVAMQVGNLLAVVIIAALTRQLAWAAALPLAAAMLGGSLWALLLTLVIWRLYPYGPARRAVAQCYRALADLAADLRLRLRDDAGPASWEAHARAHRRAVRDALEAARQATMDAAAGRGSPGLRLAQTLLRLEAADQIFGALIAMADLLEREPDPAARAAAGRMLRLLRPALLVIATAVVRDDASRTERLELVVKQIVAATPAGLEGPARALVERLRVAVTLAEAAGIAQDPPGSAARPGLRARLLDPVRQNLGWDSAILRHAVRAAVVAVPAFAFTLGWPRPYSYWLTIVLVLTLQPYFALTWQRAVERVGGTVLGGLLAAALGFVCTDGLSTAIAFVPLAVLAFAARRVSFGAFIMLLTPMVILLIELARPGTSDFAIAWLRVLYTSAGGLLAVAGCLALWPSWEPDRLAQERAAAIAAHARFAAAVLAPPPGAAADAARRDAGVASNNLEAAISRALIEPHSGRAARDRLEATMVVDGMLRRLAGRLSAVQLDPARAAAVDSGWSRWILAALEALRRGMALPTRPAGEAPESVARLARQVDMLDGALRRLDGSDRAGSM